MYKIVFQIGKEKKGAIIMEEVILIAGGIISLK